MCSRQVGFETEDIFADGREDLQLAPVARQPVADSSRLTAFGRIRQVQGENRLGDCPENVRLESVRGPIVHCGRGEAAQGFARVLAEELVEVEGEVAVGHELDGRDPTFHEYLSDLRESEFRAFGRGAVVVRLAG